MGHILIHPDDRLREPSVKVDLTNKEQLRALVLKLWGVFRKTKGLGLSAIQIGIKERLFIMHAPDSLLEFVANPVYFTPEGSEERLVEEGCLSFPGIFQEVPRFPEIWAHYYSIHPHTGEAEEVSTNLSGIKAQIFQHEFDHLDGRLLVDGIDPKQAKTITNKLKKWKMKGYTYP
jgi:peptide deformylase